jgi:2-amino-4-hydroxy-6-hydroxymethyldihydropteridine diphosphokinase
MKKIQFVAIGGNLPAPWGGPAQAVCVWAAEALAARTGLRAACRSRWFSSAPVPASDQPRYINGVVRLEGDIAPERLLAVLQAMEAEGGRIRGMRDAARTLDLDIVAMTGADGRPLVREAPDPVLPHPRAHLRAFVLLPLRDVASDWVHPVLGVGIGDLIAALPAQDIRPV